MISKPLYAQSTEPYMLMCSMPEGKFEPIEIPEDFRKDISWNSTTVFIDEENVCYLFHQRYQKQTQAVPLIQLVMKIEPHESGVLLSYFYIPQKIIHRYSNNKTNPQISPKRIIASKSH